MDFLMGVTNDECLMERRRLTLSDSDHFIPAMLTTSQNEMITSGKIQANGVVRLTDYICNPLPGKVYVLKHCFSVFPTEIFNKLDL